MGVSRVDRKAEAARPRWLGYHGVRTHASAWSPTIELRSPPAGATTLNLAARRKGKWTG